MEGLRSSLGHLAPPPSWQGVLVSVWDRFFRPRATPPRATVRPSDDVPPQVQVVHTNNGLQRRVGSLQACGFALLLATLAMIVAMALRNSDAWVAHSLDIRRASDTLSSAMKDVEASMRGYLLVGDPSLADRFDTARHAVPDAQARLRSLAQDNPAQIARLDMLAPLIDRWLAAQSKTVDIVRSGDQQALARAERQPDGANLMTRIRAGLADFDQAETDLLARREQAASRARTGSLLAGGSALSLALLLIGFTTYLNQRQARALRLANARLAGTVSDRPDAPRQSETRFRQVFHDGPIGLTIASAGTALIPGTTQDISREKAIEAALRTSEERLRLAVEAGGIGIWEHDWRRGVFQLDARAAELTGGTLPANVWLNRDGPELAAWRALIHPSDAAAYAKAEQALRDGDGDKLTCEYRVRRPDGGWSWLSAFGTVAEQDPGTGRALRVLTVLNDVTQRKDAEIELRHAHRLEAVGQLTGGVAHDFNNLLGAILGHTEFLLELVAEQSEAHELASDILDCALNGAALTQRLLAFARRQPLQPAVIDLNEYLPVHVSLLQRTLGETVTVAVALGPELWLTLADPSQIVDVLLNLAINARDAMPHGGKLTIETANAVLDAAYCARNREASPGEHVVLSVGDTGTGMTAEVLARATEPFFTTKPPGKGSGLGLSTIYGFARQSGGHLSIESALGKGTTVRLYLPRTQAERASGGGQKILAPPLPGGGEAILVVDDNDSMRMTAARNLTALGYRVRLAADGPAALTILQAGERCDLLFTDLVMPNGLSGYDLAEAARAFRPGLPVLFTTGFAPEESGDTDAAEPNALRKPYRRRELAERVRAVLDREATAG